MPSVPAFVGPQKVFATALLTAGDSAAGPEDEDAEPNEDELSETDLVDPTDEYSEVEKKSIREAAFTIGHILTHRTKNVFCDIHED